MRVGARRAAVAGARLRGRRRGRAGRRGRRRGAPAPPRRRPARHRDAGHRRPRRGRRAGRGGAVLPGADADDVRPAGLPAPGDGGRGARASSSRTRPAEQLADAVRRVAAGERVVDPNLAAATLAGGPSPLTDRERDVLVAARGGATVADVAAAAAPVRGHGAQLPVVGDRQDRRPQPRRGGDRRRGARLALSPSCHPVTGPIRSVDGQIGWGPAGGTGRSQACGTVARPARARRLLARRDPRRSPHGRPRRRRRHGRGRHRRAPRTRPADRHRHAGGVRRTRTAGLLRAGGVGVHRSSSCRRAPRPPRARRRRARRLRPAAGLRLPRDRRRMVNARIIDGGYAQPLTIAPNSTFAADVRRRRRRRRGRRTRSVGRLRRIASVRRARRDPDPRGTSRPPGRRPPRHHLLRRPRRCATPPTSASTRRSATGSPPAPR